MNTRFRIILQSIFLGLALLASTSCGAQRDRLTSKQLWIAGGAIYAGSMVGLSTLWYSQYPQSSFHLFNDNGQWLQMDKAGHAMTSYHINDAAHRALVGTGVHRRRAAWQSAGVSFLYLSGIEVLDGFSEGWGFSVGDQLANTAGIGVFLTQELAWEEQRFRLKYSYLPSEFADRNPQLLGKDWTERWLKDYNGQTYWLSANLSSLGVQASWMPHWLNVALGYGATGMLTGNGEPLDAQSSYAPVRERQLYLSLDVDLTRVPTRKRWVRVLLDAAGFIKVPAPGLNWSPSNGVGGCWVCG